MQVSHNLYNMEIRILNELFKLQGEQITVEELEKWKETLAEEDPFGSRI